MKRIFTAISSIALLLACNTEQPVGEVTDIQTLKSPDGNMEMTARSSFRPISVSNSAVFSKHKSLFIMLTALSQRKIVSRPSSSTKALRWRV